MKFNAIKAAEMRTPFYLYDTTLLALTLDTLKQAASIAQAHVHYAIKANSNPVILKQIAAQGLGADCVSGGEIRAAIEAGFSADKIFYAGVGKTDNEIRLGIELGIACFNVESFEELEVINDIATQMGKSANVALRANPNIDAHTHHYITTGLEENKFGIDLSRLDHAVDFAVASPHLNLCGLHFHIGSQITTMAPFDILCERINGICAALSERGVNIRIINVGGGLGIDYDNPDENPIADFEGFFTALHNGLKLMPGQEIHCELGRSVVAQCGSLIARVLYVKNGVDRKFLIIDGGMNDLLRPALYGAHHKIDKPLAEGDATDVYDVVGPICESSDVFGTAEQLPVCRRGDFIALRSAGAYGESMASTYNMRELPGAMFI